jgi:hypothetical protein
MLRGFISAVAVVILMLVLLSSHYAPLTCFSSEQLIPMFGLVALEHTLHPSTSLEKIAFLIENVFTHSNRATTSISFGALLALILLRVSKNRFQKYWWIYRMPEVLVVVIISTRTSDISRVRIVVSFS